MNDEHLRSPIDAAVFESLQQLDVESSGKQHRFCGVMRFSSSLVGPPKRVHGGVHPIARTLPILARLRTGGVPSRVRIDAALQKALPLDEAVPFSGTYVEDGAEYALTTRFFDGDRLLATAREPAVGELPTGALLDRFHALLAASRAEAGHAFHVIGVRYRLSETAVVLDASEPNAVEAHSHFARCLAPDGTPGWTALATQLDAVGAASQGVRMQHPHFTKHLSLSFDTEHLTPQTRLLVLGDRTTIREDETSDTPRVEIRGVSYGTSVTEVFAVDMASSRCVGHGHVWAHPVDPSKFAGFEGMRKLREV